MTDLIIHSAAQLLTIAGGARNEVDVSQEIRRLPVEPPPSRENQTAGPRRGAGQGELGIIENGAVAIENGVITAVGTTEAVRALATGKTEFVDASGCVVLPGFVDAHTHVVFAGDRAPEFELRLRGASYLDIMKAGGGIMNTVRATRAASLEQIVSETRVRLDRMLACGTTTAEAKTGYGLDTATELKLLRAIAQLDATHPVELVPTFIGAHAVPSEYQGKIDTFVDLVVEQMLPAVENSKFEVRNWKIFCDVFCDEGAFTLEQSRRILERARELGMPLKIHADEFANLGGAQLAAELGAVSADHLMVTRRDEMREMARAGVIAVLLPGTTFGLGKHDFADGRAFIEENVAVALGSDINPGTSWCESMPMIIAVATRYEKLTTAEALVAATLNAAHACGVGDRVGSLEPGKLGDVLIANVPDYRYLAYRYGTNPIRTVIKRGRVVVSPVTPQAGAAV